VVDIRDVRPVDDTCIYVLLSKLRDLKTLYMETCGDYAEAYKDSWLNIYSTPFPSVETLVWRATPIVSDDLWGNLGRFSVSPSHLVMIAMPKLKHVIGNNCTSIYESHIRDSVPATLECNLASMEFTDSAIDGDYSSSCSTCLERISCASSIMTVKLIPMIVTLNY
jgi:hypothetical protein